MDAMMAMLISVLAFGAAPTEATIPQASENWHGETVQDLHREYYNIFRKGNRNAASHLWSTFLLQRSSQMNEMELRYMFSGFCAVSGSPVRPSDYTRYKMTLDTVSGDTLRGFTYFCCWPCVCDTQDFIRVDTKNVTTADNVEHQMHFLVIGNPCEGDTDRIPYQAPEVICHGKKLEGAIMSDNGFVIISMFFPYDEELKAQDEIMFVDHCQERMKMGYNSGMGEIFRQVAGIRPLVTRTHTGELCAVSGTSRKQNTDLKLGFEAGNDSEIEGVDSPTCSVDTVEEG